MTRRHATDLAFIEPAMTCIRAMTPYEPRDHVTVLGLMKLSGGVIAAGLLVGGITYFLSGYLYFPLVFWLLPATIAMFTYDKIVMFAKVRHKTFVTLAGALLGVIVIVSFHYARYRESTWSIVSKVAERQHVSYLKAASFVDSNVAETSGMPALCAYLVAAARDGEDRSISMLLGGMPTHELTYHMGTPLVWGNWIVGALMILAASPLIGRKSGARDYCTRLGRWYEEMSWLGDADFAAKARLMALLDGGQFESAGRLVTHKDHLSGSRRPTLEVNVQRPIGDSDDGMVLTIEEVDGPAGAVRRGRLARWELTTTESESFLTGVRDRGSFTLPPARW